MTSSKRENSVHIRLDDEADALAELLATAGNVDKSKLLADILHRALLGEGYALKVAAMRFSRLGLTGNPRDYNP